MSSSSSKTEKEVVDDKSSNDDGGEAQTIEEEPKSEVDEFDPEAVDFEPVMKSYSGTAVSYHSQEHHADEVKSLPSVTSSMRCVRSSTPKNRKRENDLFSGESSKATPVISNMTIKRQESATNPLHDKSKSNVKKKDTSSSHFYFLESYHYIVVSMAMFILMVLVTNVMQQPLSLHTNVVTILPKEVQDYIKKVYPPPVNTKVPPEIRMAFQDVEDMPIAIMDTPLLWKIPRSGTTTLQLILTMCMGRTVASEQGAEHRLDERLYVLTTKYGNFVNVDPSTPLGIEHAVELGLIPSRVADVVITPHLYLSTRLFDAKHKGRLFTLLRDPLDRLVSLYYFLRVKEKGGIEEIASSAVASSSSGVTDANNMTLHEFAMISTDNWHVRMLSNTMSGQLTIEHLDTAKEVLRTKFLIGLLEKKTESLRRIETYFGWKMPSKMAQTCKNKMFYFEPLSKNPHPELDLESREARILMARNQLDMELYQYAKLLFSTDQKQMIAKMKRGK